MRLHSCEGGILDICSLSAWGREPIKALHCIPSSGETCPHAKQGAKREKGPMKFTRSTPA